MVNVKRTQIKNLFSNTSKMLSAGIWFSGTLNKGTFARWDPDTGNMVLIKTLEDGKLEGEFKLWKPDGTLISHILSKKGKLIKDYLEAKD